MTMILNMDRFRKLRVYNKLYIALLICSITLWSQRVKAGCPDLFACTTCGYCCDQSTTGGTCGAQDSTYKYHCAASCYSASSSTSTYTTASPVQEEEYEEAAAVAAGASVLAAAAAAPPPLPMMAPQGLPQPGSVSAGGGVLPATAFANALVAAQVGALVSGISGAVVLAVFSSNLAETGFLIPRTVPATAALFSEPNLDIPRTTISRRQSSSSHSLEPHSCPRPIIRLGQKIDNAHKNLERKTPPIIKKIFERFSTVQSKLAMAKARIVNKLGIACLFPKILRPFRPTFEYLRCKLGLEDDGYMETPGCDDSTCVDSELEDREITQDRGVPNLDFMRMEVATMDDCFADMQKVTYGARVDAKIVDDVPCEDPKYQDICKDLEEENKIVMEDSCSSFGCVDPRDDPFRTCFGCEDATVRARSHDSSYYDFAYNFIDRQSGERFQVTRQRRRLICTRNAGGGGRSCKLRISRGMQLRTATYGRAQQFVQSEQYLSRDDIDIIRKYLASYYSQI